MLTQERKEELLKFCQKMIQAKSYSGHEDKVVDVLRAHMEHLGYDEIHIDDYGNIIGTINGNRPGKTILFDGHIDTVPVADESQWSSPPFEARLVGDKIIGRGTSDMKGAVSAFVSAAAYFAQDCKKDFPGRVCVSGSVQEECFEGVAPRLVSEYIKPDYVVIGEASELNLKRGQRGRAELVIETFGVPAHSANPEKGINAVHKMMKAIAEIEKITPPTHPLLGEGISVLTDIKSEPYPGASVVPQYCRATYDRRLLVGETKESVLKPVKDVLERLQKEDKDFKAKVSYAYGKEQCFTGAIIEDERFFPGWELSEDDEYVQAAYKGLKEAGFDPKITHYSFCTNGSHFAGEKNIKTIGFGPSLENLAHTTDEYITVDMLNKGATGFYAIIKAVLQ